MTVNLDEATIGQLFTKARTHNGWVSESLDREILEKLYDIARWGPTSFNSSPARFIFLTSENSKSRLKPHLLPGNVDKTMTSPCCVIVAWDNRFFEKFTKLMPFIPASMFESQPELVQETAFRNSSLEGAYLIIAARALGLDVGPMQGFDRAGVDKEFFPNGGWTTNFLINIGHGDLTALRPRMPRLDFAEACEVL